MLRLIGSPFLILAFLTSCGGPSKPPTRGVIESDLNGWGFRRYQQVLDIEVWIKKNKARAHTASYARISSEKKGRIESSDIISAFVTRYKKPKGIVRALIVFVRRLAQQSGYKVEERKLKGVRLYEVAGPGEYWLFWAAKGHIVKLGGPGRESVAGAIVSAYGERYPSLLKSGSLEGSLSDTEEEPEVESEEFDPDNPKPEWQ